MPRKIKQEILIKAPIPGSIGERIQTVRKYRNLTQQELAEKIGVKRHLIADYEQGRHSIYDEIIIAIAIFLEISTDELLGLKPLKGINLNINKKRIRH